MKTVPTRFRHRALWLWLPLIAGALVFGNAAAEDAPGRGPDTAVSNRFSVVTLLEQAVENRDGDVLGKLQDIIVSRKGRVELAVVAVEAGAPPGTVKKVGVPFGDLEVVMKWRYRTVRKKDGTEKRVAWRQQKRIIFEGGRADLLKLPAYEQIDRYPRGSASGWGVYSQPPETATEQ
jgi:sporulation protein YlmC with PRC-barrel domain